MKYSFLLIATLTGCATHSPVVSFTLDPAHVSVENKIEQPVDSVVVSEEASGVVVYRVPTKPKLVFYRTHASYSDVNSDKFCIRFPKAYGCNK